MLKIRINGHRCTWPVVIGSLTFQRFLIDRGSDSNSLDKDGSIPLHLTSRYRHVDVARLLLDRGSDVNALEVDKWTPLHLASYDGHLDIAKLLVGRGANMGSQNDNGGTPLKYAAWSGYLDNARFGPRVVGPCLPRITVAGLHSTPHQSLGISTLRSSY